MLMKLVSMNVQCKSQKTIYMHVCAFMCIYNMGFLRKHSGKNLPANAGDAGLRCSSSWVRKISCGRKVNLLLYSGLENPMIGGAWRANAWDRKESNTAGVAEHV